MGLNPKHATWLESRSISPETGIRLGLYSARPAQGGGVPDQAGDVLVFPFIEDGREVNAKFRGPGKKFWQKADSRKTFFNADVITDPAVTEGKFPLVITEGEPDALSFIESGFPFAVSVPDGAPPARDDNGDLIAVVETADDVDSRHDEKYSYVHNNWARLKAVKRIVLATDADEPGLRLRDELARRLGRARCLFVTYPEGCKDANDVLRKHGPGAVSSLVTQAKPFPVRGLYKLSDFPDEKPIRVYETGFPALRFNPNDPKAPHFRMYRGAFMILSGLPGGGKTAWALQLGFNMAAGYDWRIGVASFEMRISPTLRDMLRGFFLRRPQSEWTAELKREVDEWIEEHFSFVALMPDDEDTEADIDWVIDRGRDAVVRDGIDLFIIDPWNEVDHKRKNGETSAEYTNRAIRSLKRFCHNYDTACLIVAHPTKDAGTAAMKGEKIGLYHVDHGAAWANKAEIGLIISRTSPQDTMSELAIRKVKFPGTGRLGEVYQSFDESLLQFVS